MNSENFDSTSYSANLYKEQSVKHVKKNSFFTQIIGVVFAAAYMVAKGSDLVKTAQFVKRAFIELLKKVVSCA